MTKNTIAFCVLLNLFLLQVAYSEEKPAEKNIDKPSIGVLAFPTAVIKDKKSAGLSKRDSLMVIGIIPHSPASSKIEIGDLIIAANGKPVATMDELAASLVNDNKDAFIEVRKSNGASWKSAERIKVTKSTLRKIAISSLNESKDGFSETTLYRHIDDKLSVNGMSLAFAKTSERVSPLMVSIYYEGKDWVFINSITLHSFKTGSSISNPEKMCSNFELKIPRDKMSSDAFIGGVRESGITSIDEIKVKELKPHFTHSGELILRLSGDKANCDVPIEMDRRMRMMSILIAHSAMSEE